MNSTLLFRPAALAAGMAPQTGRPIALMPISWWLLACFIATLAGAIILFLATETMVRKETALGLLRLSHGELRLLPPKPGLVRQVLVQDGQDVGQGDPLVVISTEQSLTGGGTVDAQLLNAIANEERALNDRLQALDRSGPLEIKAMAERLEGLQRQITELSAEQPKRRDRLEAARDAYEAGQRFFEHGTVSENDLRQRRYDLLAQEQAMGDYKTQLAQLHAQAAETAASLAKLPSDQAQTRATVRQELVTLEEKRADAEAQNGFVVKALAAGRVTALQAVPGQPAEPTKPLLTLIPPGSDLRAEIYVPSRAVGFIAPGQTVRLLYDAFPHQRFGTAHGTVAEISSTVLRPDDISAAISLKEPTYRVIVSLEKLSVNAYGHEVPLISGMALTADVILEERSFLELLFDPLIAARGRLFKD